MPVLEFHNGPLDGFRVVFEQELLVTDSPPDQAAPSTADVVVIYSYDPLLSSLVVIAQQGGIKVKLQSGEEAEIAYGETFRIGSTIFSVRKGVENGESRGFGAMA